MTTENDTASTGTTKVDNRQLSFDWYDFKPFSVKSETTEKTGELGFYEGKLHQKSVTITHMNGMPTEYSTSWEPVKDLTAEDIE